MTTPTTSTKPRSKFLLLLLSAILAVILINVILHWSDFKEGFRAGYAYASGK